MFRRIFVSLLIVSFCSDVVRAQTPSRGAVPRVRVTGSQAFEIPGVLTVDHGLVSGPSLLTDETTIQLVSLETGETLVVLKPGVQIVGRALGVANQAVRVMREDGGESIAIPLASIGQLEIGERRRHVLRGVLVGFGTFYLIGGLFV